MNYQVIQGLIDCIKNSDLPSPKIDKTVGKIKKLAVAYLLDHIAYRRQLISVSPSDRLLARVSRVQIREDLAMIIDLNSK